MKTVVLLLSYVVMVGTAKAGVPVPDLTARAKEIAPLLSARPGMPGGAEKDRAAWKALAGTKEAKEVVSRAEQALTNAIPELTVDGYLEFNRNGNRSHYQKPYLERRQALEDLVLAERFEEKGRFLKKIDAYLNAICEERSWTYPGHDSDLGNFNGTHLSIDLGSGARAWTLAAALVWLRGKIPPATDARVRSEIERRVFTPYLLTARGVDPVLKINPFMHNVGNWWYVYPNNWNAVCHSWVVRTALALVESAEARAEFVAAAELTRETYLNAFTPDGYCDEGVGYWNFGFGHEMMLGLAVRNATFGRVDFLNDARHRKIMEYGYGFQLQENVSPHFADGGGNPSPELLALGRQVWPDLVCTAALKAPFLPARGAAYLPLRAFGNEPPTPSTAENLPLDHLPIRTFFPDAQVLISRMGRGGRPFAAVMKGGHNAELHNHNDVGSYTVMLDGVEMAGDPGGEVYTRRTFSPQRYDSKVLNSYGHPVPYPASTLQSPGRPFAGRVLEKSFSDGVDRFTLDLRGAYELPSLRALERTLVFDRGARAVTISDKVAFASPQTFSVPIITYCKHVKGTDAGHFVLQSADGSRKVGVEIAVTGGNWKLVPETIENPERPSVTRLAVVLDRAVASAEIAVTYRCMTEQELLPERQ